MVPTNLEIKKLKLLLIVFYNHEKNVNQTVYSITGSPRETTKIMICKFYNSFSIRIVPKSL